MRTMTDGELEGMSEEFRNFYKSLRDFDGHDGIQVNTPALISLGGAERDLAEGLLIERIEGEGGSVILALGEMKSQKGGAVLKEYAQRVGGTTAVDVARALWRIERWADAQAMIIEVLEGRRNFLLDSGIDDVHGRAAAAGALAEFPGDSSKEALHRALDDPDSLVRYWAQVSLNSLGRNLRQ